MKKILKICLVMLSLLVVTVNSVSAQSIGSEMIEVNNLLGEDISAERPKHLFKVNLIDEATGTIHDVLYYWTPNSSDITLSQIRDDLAARNIAVNMDNIPPSVVDNEVKDYQTNLGVLSTTLVSANIPLVNPETVPINETPDSNLMNVTALPEVSSITHDKIVTSIAFKTSDGEIIYNEYFLTRFAHEQDKIGMAMERFKEKFPQYAVDTNGAYESYQSNEPQMINTNLGEINAFYTETTVPVSVSKAEEAPSTTTVTTTTVETNQTTASQSSEVPTTTISSTQQVITASPVATTTVTKAGNKLPSTGEASTSNTVKIVGVVLLLGVGIFMMGRRKQRK